jgi:hypothetical protein
MTRIRRSVLLLVLSIAAVLAAALPADATFADSAPVVVKPAIGTLTVEGPGSVRVDTSCVTTTTVIKKVFDSTTNAFVSSSQTSSVASSTTNVESDTTVRTDNAPVVGQYTLTQTIKDTMLYATARWKGSSTRGVTGYQMTAFLNSGVAVPMDNAPANATSTDGQYDASVMNYGARLSMVTLTSYGWTAPGALSNVVTC